MQLQHGSAHEREILLLTITMTTRKIVPLVHLAIRIAGTAISTLEPPHQSTLPPLLQHCHNRMAGKRTIPQVQALMGGKTSLASTIDSILLNLAQRIARTMKMITSV